MAAIARASGVGPGAKVCGTDASSGKGRMMVERVGNPFSFREKLAGRAG